MNDGSPTTQAEAQPKEVADPAPAQETTEAAAEAQSDQDTSAETEKTALASDKQAAIPYPRFKQVNDERKAAKERNKALEARIQELESAKQGNGEPAFVPKDLADPPEGLSVREQAAWMIRNDADLILDELLEKRFGMKPQQIQSLLAATRPVIEDNAEKRFAKACEKHKLDSQDNNVRLVVSSLMQQGKKIDEALKMVAEFRKEKGSAAVEAVAAEVVENQAEMESGGVTSTMAQGTALPKTREEAAALAHKGVKVKRPSITTILAKKT